MKVSNHTRFITYTNHIIEEMEFLLQYENYSLNMVDKKDQRAMERAFEIIGEATKRLASSPFYEKYPEIEWSEMAKHRDFIAHHYDDIIISRLLTVIKTDIVKNLPLLKKLLEAENDTE